MNTSHISSFTESFKNKLKEKQKPNTFNPNLSSKDLTKKVNKTVIKNGQVVSLKKPSFTMTNLASSESIEIIQSHILTTAKYNLTVYEKRILYRIIESFQPMLKGLKLEGKYTVTQNIFEEFEFIMPISSFLASNTDTNHAQVKKAFKALMSTVIEVETDKEWRAYNLLERPVLNKETTGLSFRLSPDIARAFLDFTKGYKKFELKLAMSFNSAYTMRFYELLSSNKTTIIYKIDYLREILAIGNKYPRTFDFIKNVIEVAQKELDEKSAYSFEYERITTGRSITAISFTPKYIPANRDVELDNRRLKKQVSTRFTIPKNISDYLKNEYDFTTQEIKNNLELFEQALKTASFDFVRFLADERVNAKKAKNPKGWLIGAIRKQIKS